MDLDSEGTMGDTQLSLKWNHHKATLCKTLAVLRKKELYTDVTLVCENVFHAVHKFVLSSCSEYFSEILEHTKGSNPVIVLKDISTTELAWLLDYMYLGEVDVPQSRLAGLIKAADYLKIRGLSVPDDDKAPSSNLQGPDEKDVDEEPPPTKRRRKNSEDRQGKEGNTKSPAPSQQRTSKPPSSSAQYQHPVSLEEDIRESHKTTYTDDSTSPDKARKGNLSPQRTEDGSMGALPFIKVEEEEVEVEEHEATTDGENNIFKEETLDQSQNAHQMCEASIAYPRNYTGDSLMVPQGIVAGPSDTQAGEVPVSWNAAADTGGPLGLLDIASQLISSGNDIRKQKQPPPLIGGMARKPFVCPYCSKEFKNSSHCDEHIRTHTKERPYCCPHCCYRSAHLKSITRHLHNQHPGLPNQRHLIKYCPQGTEENASPSF